MLNEVQSEMDRSAPTSSQPAITIDLDPPSPEPSAPQSPTYTPYVASPSPRVSPMPSEPTVVNSIGVQTGDAQLCPSTPPSRINARVSPLEPSTFIWVASNYTIGPDASQRPMYVFNPSFCSWDLAHVIVSATSPF